MIVGGGFFAFTLETAAHLIYNSIIKNNRQKGACYEKP